MADLKAEFEFYLAHQAELVDRHLGKFVVIKGQQVIGVFEDQMVAVQETQKAHQLGTFLVQKVESGTDSYSQTFRSRAVFC